MSGTTGVVLAFSGGKDSVLALARLSADPRYEVRALLTTVNEGRGRVSMHGVRVELLRAQARSLGLPLVEVGLPEGCDDATYRDRMAAALDHPLLAGTGTHAFGDIHLADVRAWREELLARCGRRAVFPLWGCDTGALAEEFVGAGWRAVVVCADLRAVPRALLGRPYGRELLAALPPGTDPCGENGEFHTFVWDGPLMTTPMRVRTGRTVVRGDHAYLDLLPAARRGRPP